MDYGAGFFFVISIIITILLSQLKELFLTQLNMLGQISGDLNIVRGDLSNQKDGFHYILSQILSKLQTLDNLHKLYQLDKLEKLNKLDLLIKLEKIDILIEQKEKELLVNFTYDSVKNRDSLNFDDNFYSPSNQKHRELIERMDNIERLLKEIAKK
jgi:hypothetical protein